MFSQFIVELLKKYKQQTQETPHVKPSWKNLLRFLRKDTTGQSVKHAIARYTGRAY